MKQSILLALFALLFCSIQIGRASQPFATGSFVLLLNIGSDSFIYEYDINGNKLQEIALPAG